MYEIEDLKTEKLELINEFWPIFSGDGLSFESYQSSIE